MLLLTILKLLVVLFFLVMFIRRPSVTWGVGLLTVTTAVLLDTFLGAFGRAELLDQLGFFFYVIAGMIVAGAAFWFWGILRPAAGGGATVVSAGAPATLRPATPETAIAEATTVEDAYRAAGYDRRMLYEQIHERFDREDLLDLMFDLELNELDVMPADQDNRRLIVNIMDAAAQQDKLDALALAVERILTPPQAAHLPRLEKLSPDSPRTVMRHYLLTHYSLAQIERAAAGLGVDWEQLATGGKREKTRSLLYYLYRRNRIPDLLDWMRSTARAKTA